MRWLRAFACALALCVAGFASAQEPGDDRIVFPASVSQGALVFGKVPAGSVVEYAGRTLRPTPYGTVVFGVDRREQGPLRLEVLRRFVAAERVTRVGEPAHIANLAAFVLGPEGRFLQGALVDMDGGATKTI